MNKGDIVKLDYELWIVENDKRTLIETTQEDIAKANGLYDPNAKYSPRYVILGKNVLLKAFEENLMNSEIDKENVLTLTPDKGYGERTPKLVKIHSYRDFEKEEVTPEVGKIITLKGNKGKVIRVTPGRIVVDYNNPLAGKTLEYKYTVKEVVTDLVAQVKALIDMYYSFDIDKFEVTVSDDSISINVAESAKYKSEWAIAKFNVVAELRERTDKTLKFVETYEPIKKEEKPAEPTVAPTITSQPTKEEKTNDSKEATATPPSSP